jgi:hypothetical protein
LEQTDLLQKNKKKKKYNDVVCVVTQDNNGGNQLSRFMDAQKWGKDTIVTCKTTHNSYWELDFWIGKGYYC